MTQIEQLKALHEGATPLASWHYSTLCDAVVYVSDHRLKAVADLGKVDNGLAHGEFIALSHNMTPYLVEAVALLKEARASMLNGSSPDWGWTADVDWLMTELEKEA